MISCCPFFWSERARDLDEALNIVFLTPSITHSLNRRQDPPVSMPIRHFPSCRRSELRVRIRALVFEGFDEFVEEDGEEGAADGTDPVDPLRGVEGVDSDGGAEGAGGVKGAAGPENAWGLGVSGGNSSWDVGFWGWERNRWGEYRARVWCRLTDKLRDEET